LSKRVHEHAKSDRFYPSPTYYWSEDTAEFGTSVVWASIPIMRFHQHVAQKSSIQPFQATLYNTGQMQHCELHHWSIETTRILHEVDFEQVYSHSASGYHYLK
jgi:hypothetical protein